MMINSNLFDESDEYVTKPCVRCQKKKTIKYNSFIQNVKNHDGKYICSSCSHSGLKKDNETKEKISKALKGRKLSLDHKNKIKNSMRKTWRSDGNRYKKIIGIFRGKFDPPHNGHFSLASSAILSSKMNEIWWTPTNDISCQASFQQREKMIDLYIKKYKQFRCFDFEIKNNLEDNYFVLMESLFKIKRYSRYCFYLILGSDEAEKIKKNKNYEWLLSNVRLWIFHRKGFNIQENDSLIKNLKNNYIKTSPIVDISSSQIRNNNIKNGEINIYSNNISEYISNNNIYKKEENKNE